MYFGDSRVWLSDHRRRNLRVRTSDAMARVASAGSVVLLWASVWSAFDFYNALTGAEACT